MGDKEKLKSNLLIAFSWVMGIANRLHIVAEQNVLQRFPGVCSCCRKASCICKRMNQKKRIKNLKKKNITGSLADLQKMFSLIYPPSARSLFEAGVHLAEEAGELSEAIYCFSGEHKAEQFEQIKIEIADYISCLFGVANSAEIDVAKELGKMYRNNCHVCHEAPCICKLSFIAKFES